MRTIRLLASLFFLLSFSSLNADAGSLSLGSVGESAPDDIKKFQPLASYLARHLSSEGIDEGRVVVANNMSAMADLIREGKVDLYIDSPVPSILVSRHSGSRFLLRRWKKGVAEYFSLIFTRKDSGIDTLKDLRGKIIAFEEPYSSTGHFLPRLALARAGFKLVPKRDASERVEPNEIGTIFSNDDENSMLWVLRGKVAAAAMDDQSFLREARDRGGELKVLHQSIPLPRHLVSYRWDLPANLVEKIRAVLLQMESSEEGRKVLMEFEKTAKFDEIPEGAIPPLLELTRSLDIERGIP